MLALLGASAALAAAAIPSHAAAFTDAERFERWSHFKDVGLPAVVPAHDTLDEAAIADGTCRLLAGASYGGDHFFLQPTRVQRVLDALGNATPPTAGPSRFTLRASDALAQGCADPLFYELGAELTYPASEAISGAVLVLVWNMTTLVVLALPPSLGRTMNWIWVAGIGACLLLVASVRERYLRPIDDALAVAAH